jgi:hypothetical protein
LSNESEAKLEAAFARRTSCVEVALRTVKGGLNMRRFFLSALLCAPLTLLAATGCDKPDSKSGGTTGSGGDLVVLEVEEIDLIPGAEKQVKVKSGSAKTADAPKDSGVTAKVEGDHLTVAAAKDAKDGAHQVTVKGGKKDTTLKVNVKKEAGGK